MKKQEFRTLAMLSLLLMLAVASVQAQSSRTKKGLKANIPFEFAFGQQTFPAGTYTVEVISSDGSVLDIYGTDSRHRALTMTSTATASRVPEQTRLVFHRYGDNYFLSQVWMGADNLWWQLRESRRERAIERELAKNSARRAQAKNTPERQIVTLIASK